MFRDTKEELQRLEEQLFEEEELQTPEKEEARPDPYESRVYTPHAPEMPDEEEIEPEKKDQSISTLATVVFILLCAILLVLGAFLLRAGGYL